MKYIPVESVLYDLSLSMDPSLWNTSAANEWALKSLRSIGGLSLFQDKIEYYQVTNHTLKFPEGLRIFNMGQVYMPSIGYSQTDNNALLERIQRRMMHPHPELFLEGSYGYTDLGPNGQTIPASVNNNTSTYASKWRTLYKTTNAFCSACDPHNHIKCVPEYKELTDSFHFSFKDGIVCLNYKSFAESGEGYLMPDIEDLKESIRYYILYRIYESLCRTDQTQFNINERDRNMKLYSSFRLKAVGKIAEQNLNLGTMEVLRMQNNRMIRGNQFAKGFAGLNQPDQTAMF